MERFAVELDALDTDFSTLGEFEAFADELNRLADNWDLTLLDETDAACGALKEALEEELGYEVEICG